MVEGTAIVEPGLAQRGVVGSGASKAAPKVSDAGVTMIGGGEGRQSDRGRTRYRQEGLQLRRGDLSQGGEAQIAAQIDGAARGWPKCVGPQGVFSRGVAEDAEGSVSADAIHRLRAK